MQYKVLKNWGNGVTGSVGPDVGSIINIDSVEAKERLAREEVEEVKVKVEKKGKK